MKEKSTLVLILSVLAFLFLSAIIDGIIVGVIYSIIYMVNSNEALIVAKWIFIFLFSIACLSVIPYINDYNKGGNNSGT